MIMKKLSAGVIFHDSHSMLVGHCTGSSRWDIPKGLIEEGEEPINAAIRELKEETDFSHEGVRRNIKYIGFTPYLSNKDLFLYDLSAPSLPPLSSYSCNSYFDKKGIKTPEFDSFKYASWDEIHSGLLIPAMITVIDKYYSSRFRIKTSIYRGFE